MLWQLAYSEIYFEKKLWPDFTTKDYNKILNKFKRHKKKFWKNMNNLQKRIFTSIVLIAIVLSCLFVSSSYLVNFAFNRICNCFV